MRVYPYRVMRQLVLVGMANASHALELGHDQRRSDVSIQQLRSDLAAARFTVEALTSLWGADAAAALHRAQRVPAIRALTTETPLATLARAFVLGLPVDLAALDRALPSLRSQGAIELGLVDTDGNPLLDLRPYSFVDAHGVGGWWIASDLGELSTGAPLREDHVLGIGGASTTLSGLMVDRPVKLALDLGTGCGIQALHAARHAERVIATDISPRALAIAAFNAELNGVTNIEFREGSLFDPVAEERFDHIVSNPPFVITPRTEGVPEYEYRDGGMVGDALVATVIAGLRDHLTPTGVAQLLGNWEYRAHEDGLDRAAAWIRASGLGGWVIEREVQDSALYAETWIRDGGTRPGREFDRLYGAWLDDFDIRGVTAVGFGYLTFENGTALLRAERLAGPVGSGLGPHIGESLDSHRRLATLQDDELAKQLLVVAPDVTEERHYWPGDADPTVLTLRQGSGFQRSASLDTGLAALVGACDGELSVRSIVAAIAQLLEVNEHELLADLLSPIRDLIFAGFLRFP
jgi:methylase of polypeptide subunit release factors